MKNKHHDEYVMLGLNIMFYRRLAGLTQEQLAEAINISRTHLGKIEIAQSCPALDVLLDIAEVLKNP